MSKETLIVSSQKSARNWMDIRRSGKLILGVLEASGLAQLGPFPPDAFCQVSLSGQPGVRQTRAVLSSCSPRWNEEFSLSIPEIETSRLTVQIWDSAFTIHELLARCTIPLRDYIPENGIVEWYDLTPVPGVHQGGRIHLDLKLSSSRRFNPHPGLIPGEYPPDITIPLERMYERKSHGGRHDRRRR
jgi:Ca2+-dependent lipid-binding protein